MTPALHPGFPERLVGLGVLATERAVELAAAEPAPWWLAALQGLAAWVASFMIMSSFFAPLLLLGEGPLGRGVAGAALLGAALWLFRRGHPFTAQMGLAFSLAGQALVVGAFAGELDGSVSFRILSLAGLLVATGMFLAPATQLHRVVCALLMTGHLGTLVGPGNPLALYAVALAALAVGAWLVRGRWTPGQAQRIKALVHAATLAALVVAVLVGTAASRGIMASADATATLNPAVYPAGISLVLLFAAAWLARGGTVVFRMVSLGAALLFVIAAWRAPGLIASAAVVLAVFHACHRAWAVLALLAALLYLGEFYYSLHATLLVKSGALAATGLLLLGLRYGLGIRGRVRT
jgi:hypothetical protein